MLFIVLAFASLGAALRRPGPARAVLAMAFAILSVQSLYTCAPLLAGVCAAGAVSGLASRSFSRALLSASVGVAAALSLLPYTPALAAARSWIALMRAQVGAAQAWSAFREAAAGDLWLWIVLGLTALILATRRAARPSGAASVGEDSAGDRATALYAGTALAAGTAAFLLGAFASRLAIRPWYFLPWMALAAACMDALAAPLFSRPGARNLAALALALLTALHLVAAQPALRMRQTNLDLIAAKLRESAAPGDLVVVYPWFLGPTFHRYDAGPARWITNPPLADTRIHRFDLVAQAMRSPEAVDSTLSEISRTLRSGGTVWLAGGLPRKRPGALPARASLPPEQSQDASAYNDLWGNLVAEAVREHATDIAPVPVPADDPVNPSEYELLFRLRGWR
jgi:hypothetical protein